MGFNWQMAASGLLSEGARSAEIISDRMARQDEIKLQDDLAMRRQKASDLRQMALTKYGWNESGESISLLESSQMTPEQRAKYPYSQGLLRERPPTQTALSQNVAEFGEKKLMRLMGRGGASGTATAVDAKGNPVPTGPTIKEQETWLKYYKEYVGANKGGEYDEKSPTLHKDAVDFANRMVPLGGQPTSKGGGNTTQEILDNILKEKETSHEGEPQADLGPLSDKPAEPEKQSLLKGDTTKDLGASGAQLAQQIVSGSIEPEDIVAAGAKGAKLLKEAVVAVGVMAKDDPEKEALMREINENSYEGVAKVFGRIKEIMNTDRKLMMDELKNRTLK